MAVTKAQKSPECVHGQPSWNRRCLGGLLHRGVVHGIDAPVLNIEVIRVGLVCEVCEVCVCVC